MKDLTKGNIYKTFFLFALPLVLAGILTQLYSLVDSAIAGHFLGEVGLAAISATAPLTALTDSLFWGLCTGFSIYVARLFSSQQYYKLKSVFYTFMLLILALGTLIGGGFVLCYQPLADLLKIAPEIRRETFLYFAIVNAGKGVLVLGALLVYTLNAMGVSGFTFWMSLLSGILNVVGNILSVIVLHWGVAGIALSTVFASFVVNVCYMFKIQSCFKRLDHGEKPIRLRFSYLKNTLPYSLPSMAQQVVMYLAGLFISPLINGMGVEAIASYSVATHLNSFIASVYQNSGRTLSNYASQCVGTKQYSKIKKGVWVGLLQGVVFSTPFLLACVIFNEEVCGIFLKADASALVKEYSYAFARNYLPFCYFNFINNLFHSFYRGVKAMGHLLVTTLCGSIVVLIASRLLIPQIGMYGFYWGLVLSWIAEALLTTILYLLGKWMPEEANA